MLDCSKVSDHHTLIQCSFEVEWNLDLKIQEFQGVQPCNGTAVTYLLQYLKVYSKQKMAEGVYSEPGGIFIKFQGSR